MARGADKAALDARGHTAAYRARRKELSSEIQELLYTPGCNEEETKEDSEEDDVGGVWFDDEPL